MPVHLASSSSFVKKRRPASPIRPIIAADRCSAMEGEAVLARPQTLRGDFRVSHQGVRTVITTFALEFW